MFPVLGAELLATEQVKQTAVEGAAEVSVEIKAAGEIMNGLHEEVRIEENSTTEEEDFVAANIQNNKKIDCTF